MAVWWQRNGGNGRQLQQWEANCIVIRAQQTYTTQQMLLSQTTQSIVSERAQRRKTNYYSSITVVIHINKLLCLYFYTYIYVSQGIDDVKRMHIAHAFATK